MGQTWPLFCLFSFFSHNKYSTNTINVARVKRSVWLKDITVFLSLSLQGLQACQTGCRHSKLCSFSIFGTFVAPTVTFLWAHFNWDLCYIPRSKFPIKHISLIVVIILDLKLHARFAHPIRESNPYCVGTKVLTLPIFLLPLHKW